MSLWRIRRQASILGLLLVVFVTIGVLLYVRYKPVPSCTDGVLNQAERGIDCGGPCARVCKDEAVPLTVEWARAFRVVDGHYDVVAKVRNSNNQIGVPSVPYIVEIFDAENVSISRRTGTTFANANETFYIFESNLFAGQRIPKYATLTINEPLVWNRVEAAPLKLTIINKVFEDGIQPAVIATILNESLTSLRNVTLVAVLYDESGNAYGGSATLVETLPKDARQDISFVWREPFELGPTNIDIFPRVNTFNPTDTGSSL